MTFQLKHYLAIELYATTLSLGYNLALLSLLYLFYQIHFHFYFNDVSGFSYFFVAK